jgi:predicted outer membrane repeat protein
MLRPAFFVALAMLAAPEAVCAAPSFVVDSVLDAVDDNVNDTVCHTAAGTCTLRAAIMQANHYSGTGTVAITVPAGTYVLSIAIAGSNGDDSGDLNLTAAPPGNSTVSISGAGAATTVIDADQIDRAFSIVGRFVAISGLTIRNGHAGGGNGGAILGQGTLTLTDAVIELSQANLGGGIENDSDMTLVNVVIKDNSATAGGGISNTAGLPMLVSRSTIKSNTAIAYGGGIYNSHSLTIDRSTISANATTTGGGIYNIANPATSADMTMTNSTVSGNHAQGRGGGIATAGTGTLTVAIFSSSIIANEAAANLIPGGRGGGLAYASSGVASLHNSLIAGNYLSGGSSYEDCYSPGTLIYAYGLDLFSASPFNDCPFNSPASVGLTTMLAIGPLQGNGGPTFTHALLASSNAIGAVTSANCTGADAQPVPVDQRGVSRVTNGFCDVGAFEYDFGRIFANGFDPP